MKILNRWPISGLSSLSRVALSALATAFALAGVAHATNTADPINATATSDLSATANYKSGPTSSLDVEFAAGPYTNTSFSVNGTALAYGTLDDLDTTQSIVIGNTSSTAGSITLSSTSNGLGSATADLLFVKSGANLTLQSGTGTLTLDLTNTGSIEDGGTLTLGGPVLITGGKTITFTGAGATTVSGVISQTAASAGIAVNALGGSVTFDAAEGYTGATTLNSGTLVLDFSAAGAPTSNIITGTNTLALGGGTLSVNGNSSTPVTQAFGATTLTAGTSSEILLNNNAAADSPTVTLASLTQGAGATIYVNIANGGTLAVTGTPSNIISTGNVLGYGVVTDASGTSFAVYSGGDLVKLTGQAAFAASGDVQSGNYIETLTGSSTSAAPGFTLGSNPTINSLTIDSTNATGANYIDLGGDTLAIESGGLLILGGQNLTLQDGTILGSGTSSDLYVHTYGTGTVTIDTTLIGTGGTGNLDKDGSGTLVLGSAQTYTGTTNIEAGTLDLANSAALFAGATTSSTVNLAQGASLVFDSSVTSNAFTIGSLEGAGNIALQNNGATPAAIALTVDETANTTYTGALSGAGSLIKTGSGTLTLIANNTFTGGLWVKNGTVTNILPGVNSTAADFGAATNTIYVGDVSGSSSATFNGYADTQTQDVVAGSTGELTISASNNGTDNGAIVLGYVMPGSGVTTASQNVILGNGGGGAGSFGGAISGTGNVTFYDYSNSAYIQENGGVNNVGTVSNATPSGLTAASAPITSYVRIAGVIGTNVTGVTQNSLIPFWLTGTNTFVAPITITLGAIEAGSAGALGAANAVSFNSTTGTSSLVLEETGTTTTAGSLSDANATAGTDSVVLSYASTTSDNTLSIGNSGTTTTNFGGVISDGNFAGEKVTKTGTSTQSLSGANTYSGATTVNGGTLAANNASGSATGTGAVTVNSGATFGGGNGASNVGGAPAGVLASYGVGGSGNISYVPTYQTYAVNKVGIVTGSTEIKSGGTLAPGNAGQVGTLTVGSLTLDAGSLLAYEFNSSTLSNSFTDVTVSGGLMINGGTFTLVDQNGAIFGTAGVYDLFQYSGTLGGSLSNLSVAAADQVAGDTYTFVDDTADDIVQLDITSTAPEPKTWALLIGGITMMGFIVRRRREV